MEIQISRSHQTQTRNHLQVTIYYCVVHIESTTDSARTMPRFGTARWRRVLEERSTSSYLSAIQACRSVISSSCILDMCHHGVPRLSFPLDILRGFYSDLAVWLDACDSVSLIHLSSLHAGNVRLSANSNDYLTENTFCDPSALPVSPVFQTRVSVRPGTGLVDPLFVVILRWSTALLSF